MEQERLPEVHHAERQPLLRGGQLVNRHECGAQDIGPRLVQVDSDPTFGRQDSDLPGTVDVAEVLEHDLLPATCGCCRGWQRSEQ